MNKTGIFIGLALLATLLFAANLLLGSVHFPMDQWTAILAGEHAQLSSILWQIRFPAAITAVLAGAGLSASGLLMQTFFRNPVAGPFIFGISSGAALGVALLVLAGSWLMLPGPEHWSSSWLLIAASVAGSLAVFALVMLFAGMVRSITVLLIIGMMIAAAISAFIAVLQSFATAGSLQRFVNWGFGSFQHADLSQLWLPAVLIPLLLLMAYAMAPGLNLALLGDDYAFSSGLDLKRFRWKVMLLGGILAGIVTAYAGPIAFIGLAVPHLARVLFRTSDHRQLVPAVVCMGALVALAAQLIARVPGSEFSLPLNAVTSLIGAPVVVWVLLGKKYRISE